MTLNRFHISFYFVLCIDEGRKKLQEYFDLCDPLTTPESVYSLAYELADAWGSVAMVNYPYPTEFLQPLPAWPVSVS